MKGCIKSVNGLWIEKYKYNSTMQHAKLVYFTKVSSMFEMQVSYFALYCF